MTEKPINGSKGWTVLLSSIIAAMVGSGGGTYFYISSISADELQRIARPDPATGTELRALRREMEYHLRNHPDIANEFLPRIVQLETKVDIIIQNQQRLLKK